jgi:hypothetical protein
MTRSKKRKIAKTGVSPIDYGDLARKELMRRADIAYRIGWDVRFKFTCVACGTRCAFAVLNKLWTEGECSSCGRTTIVVKGGFMLQATRPTAVMMNWMTLPDEMRFSEKLFAPVAA